MSKWVKEFVEISECGSLDALIEQLVAVRESLPDGGGAEVKMRGDEVFGRRLSIAYYRPQTQEEAEFDARYANAYRQSREREMARLQEELGVVCRLPRQANGSMRIVA